MPFSEVPIEQNVVYEGIIVSVRSDKARLDNGKIVPREVVEHPGGVAIVALTDGGRILVERQYRYAFSTELLEIPAGKLERGEDPLDCAKRELSEETGYTAQTWHSLGAIYPSPGFCKEVLHLYIATGLQKGEAHPDADEFLSVHEVTFAELVEMIMSNTLTDAKTVVGVLKAERFLKERGIL